MMNVNREDCWRAADRIRLLFRDLRRQREAWADNEDDSEIEAGNPDIPAFNRAFEARGIEGPEVLIDFIAGIIAEELGRGAKTDPEPRPTTRADLMGGARL